MLDNYREYCIRRGEENSLNKRNDFNRLIFARTVDRKNLFFPYHKIHIYNPLQSTHLCNELRKTKLLIIDIAIQFVRACAKCDFFF